MDYNMSVFISRYLNFFALFFIFCAYFSTLTFYFSFTFYKEIFATFGLLIFLLGCFFQKKIYLTKPILLSITLITIPLVQYAFGIIFFLQDALFTVIYFCIFIFSAFIGLNFKVNQQKRQLNTFLVMLVFVGCLCVFMAFNQYFSWLKSNLLFPSSHGSRVSANLGQPNQLSTLLIMSLFSLFYLYQIKIIKKTIMYLIIFLLMTGIVMTQSRSAWVSCIILSILYLYSYHQKQDILHVIKLNIIFIGLVVCVPFLLNFLTHSQSSTAIDRLQGGSTRFKIWPQLIHAVSEQPWVGYGWGQVSVAQLSTMKPDSPSGEWFTYSHNLFLDIMVCNGIVLGTGISILIIYTLYRSYINLQSKQDLMLFLGFMAFFVHSCLEYPYAYTYFLIPSGIFLGYLSYQQQVEKVLYVDSNQ